MTTDYIEPSDLPTHRTPLSRAAMTPRRGTTILFHHRPDGTVTAASRGLVGMGRTAGEAMADLDRLLKAVPQDG